MVTVNKRIRSTGSLELSIPKNAHPVVRYLAERRILATESYPLDDSTTLTLVIPKELQSEFGGLVEKHKLKREPSTEGMEIWWFNSEQNRRFVEDYRNYILFPLLEMRDAEEDIRTTFGRATLRKCLERSSQ